ncbi:hypothetical protein AB0I81_45990 [Nonomuraea sp. NPDC050404]|uniref:hypothetical protein n=1 Tax=Nonomuraea sp. NPDC050404 TaxID=3155783 RepID=UPI0033C20EE5
MKDSQPERTFPPDEAKGGPEGPTGLTERTTSLPEQTADDTDVGWGDWREDNTDAFYLDNRPPHWD